MAVSSKKAKVEGSPDAGLLVEGGSESDTDYNGGGEDCADSYSESGSSVDSNLEVVEVEFEAKNVEENDFHGIKRLLQQLFLKADISFSSLTDLIISQSSHFGSTIKISRDDEDREEGEGEEEEEEEEEREVYGISSLIHLNQDNVMCCVDQVKEHLLSQCKIHSSSHFHQLSSILCDSKKRIGLLINERFLNIPVQIGALVLRSLLKELSDCPDGLGPCEWLVVVARSHLMMTADTGQKRKKKGSGGSERKEHPVFDYHENEFLLKECLFSFTYSVSAESDNVFSGKWTLDDVAMEPCRTVIILPYNRLIHAITNLEKVVNKDS